MRVRSHRLRHIYGTEFDSARINLIVNPDAVLADQRARCRPRTSDRSVRAYTLIATSVLTAHPDLRHWMTRPAAECLAELRSIGAWPLLCHLIGRNTLRRASGFRRSRGEHGG